MALCWNFVRARNDGKFFSRNAIQGYEFAGVGMGGKRLSKKCDHQNSIVLEVVILNNIFDVFFGVESSIICTLSECTKA